MKNFLISSIAVLYIILIPVFVHAQDIESLLDFLDSNPEAQGILNDVLSEDLDDDTEEDDAADFSPSPEASPSAVKPKKAPRKAAEEVEEVSTTDFSQISDSYTARALEKTTSIREMYTEKIRDIKDKGESTSAVEELAVDFQTKLTQYEDAYLALDRALESSKKGKINQAETLIRLGRTNVQSYYRDILRPVLASHLTR